MPLRPPNSARPPNKKNHSAIRMGAISAEAMAAEQRRKYQARLKAVR